jgi:phosphoglycerol transferase MdoB-like AlkP superfamily enzyme
MGFDQFIDIAAMKLNHVGWGAPDHHLGSFVVDYLKQVEPPFISYIITMSSHGPFTNVNYYSPDSRYQDIQDETARNYIHSMSYVDKSLSDIVSNIRSTFANTYIFIFGDHAPGIKNDDYKQASIITEERNFEFVPLFIVTPDNKRYVETCKAASMLDIAPTVLQISDIKYTIKTDGENLFNSGGLANKVPFRRGLYDRSYLYKIINHEF